MTANSTITLERRTSMLVFSSQQYSRLPLLPRCSPIHQNASLAGTLHARSLPIRTALEWRGSVGASSRSSPISRRAPAVAARGRSMDGGVALPPVDEEGEDVMERVLRVGNELADAAGEVIRKYFRTSFDILHKDDLTPVTIADRGAEEAMVSIITHNFPSHAIYGEENGWRCREKTAHFVWVLDPIDGTKSFVTGKPVFGTLIALLHHGKPILGIIDQPILRERWIGMSGRRTMLNGQQVSTRNCSDISQAYMYTTSPHLFDKDAGEAFGRVRDRVKVPLYGCDCYAFALLASGFVDLVIESGLKPYDCLALVPVIEGAGGLITDWTGHDVQWEANSQSHATIFNVVASGDPQIHKKALDLLQWK